jgi:hypothetical protein
VAIAARTAATQWLSEVIGAFTGAIIPILIGFPVAELPELLAGWVAPPDFPPELFDEQAAALRTRRPEANSAKAFLLSSILYPSSRKTEAVF